MFALICQNLFSGTILKHQVVVLIEGEKILEVKPLSELATTIPRIDLGEAILVPGFIDLQLNGAGGINLNPDMNLDAIMSVHETNLKSGCTSFLPTLISSEYDTMQFAVAEVSEAMNRIPYGVLGLHLEGPYLNPQRAGVHDLSVIRRPGNRDIEWLLERSEIIQLITLAPERFSEDQLKVLSESGIRLSIGHSDASYAEAMRSFEQGICASTHLFNAMSALTSRSPGVVGAVLDHPEIYSCIIADGHHVDWPVLRLVTRLKPAKTCLVTDALAAAGTSFTAFEFANKTIYVKDQKCVDARGCLAGSRLTMLEAVQNAVRQIGCSLGEAVRMASLLPAQLLGLDHFLGRVQGGYVANLVILSSALELKGVLFRGEWKMGRENFIPAGDRPSRRGEKIARGNVT